MGQHGTTPHLCEFLKCVSTLASLPWSRPDRKRQAIRSSLPKRSRPTLVGIVGTRGLNKPPLVRLDHENIPAPSARHSCPGLVRFAAPLFSPSPRPDRPAHNCPPARRTIRRARSRRRRPSRRNRSCPGQCRTDLLVRQRTSLINALRAHLAEFGVVLPKGAPARAQAGIDADHGETFGLPASARCPRCRYWHATPSRGGSGRPELMHVGYGAASAESSSTSGPNVVSRRRSR